MGGLLFGGGYDLNRIFANYISRYIISNMTKKALSAPPIFILKFRRLATDTRKYRQISQQEIADRIGVSQSVIANFEAGKNMNPKIELICGIADALGIHLELRPPLRKSALSKNLANSLSENLSEPVTCSASARTR